MLSSFTNLNWIDRWLALSSLQKSIRRGDAKSAIRSALALSLHYRKAVIRRLIIIAFEDVGAADSPAVTYATDSLIFRGGAVNEDVIASVISSLANAPKDRSADYLICAAKDHQSLSAARIMLSEAKLDTRLRTVADGPTLPLRAAAAWYSSGLEWHPEKRVGPGSLSDLAGVYARMGVPRDFVIVTMASAKYSREPITLLPALIWLQVQKSGYRRVVRDPLPPTDMVDDIPLYALDKHTRIGRQAIRIFGRDNALVSAKLDERVSPACRYDALCMAAFYVDAAPVSIRLDWDQSDILYELGLETDMGSVGVPKKSIHPILQAVRDNLHHLNAIRRKLLIARKAAVSHQPSFL